MLDNFNYFFIPDQEVPSISAVPSNALSNFTRNVQGKFVPMFGSRKVPKNSQPATKQKLIASGSKAAG